MERRLYQVTVDAICGAGIFVQHGEVLNEEDIQTHLPHLLESGAIAPLDQNDKSQDSNS